MESTDSTSGSQHPQLPPGFRFHPTDEELVVHYLKRKANSAPLPVTIIADVDLYKFDPWELPSKATFGEQEWYFFSPRDRKYPNGARPNRAATSGYWKATGTDKPIVTSNNQKVGVKKALVFYGGKPPKGIKTNWIMHEYRLIDNNLTAKPDSASKKTSLRLDDWVLCRIYKKNNSQRPMEREREDLMEEIITHHQQIHQNQNQKSSATNIKTNNIASCYGAASSSSALDHNEENFFEGMLSSSGGGIVQNSPNTNGNVLTMASGSNNNTNGSLSVKPSMHSQYWIIDDSGSFGSLPSKRFHGDLNNGVVEHDNTSFVSLLSQIPQNSGFHENGLIDSSQLADHHGSLRQAFQLPSVNWNS